MIFKNRTSAGKKLAKDLSAYQGTHPLVLALPRGGLPVGFGVATFLEAPLDTITARKIGAPGNPEYGIGAIAPGDVVIIDSRAVDVMEVTEADLEEVLIREREELERRMVLYRSGSYSDKNFDTVIIVDDGLATGVTARAAIESVRLTRKPKRVVYASPICAEESSLALKTVADEVVCSFIPRNLFAIGCWYDDFTQVTDDEVLGYLERAQEKVLIH